MTSIRVEIIDADAAVDLRRAVLRPEIPPGEYMPAFAPPGAVHLGALDENGLVIGTCTIFEQAYPTRPEQVGAWQLRGMATDAARHGRGIGSAVLAKAEEHVRGRGGRLLWCNARVSAIGFYEHHGWVAEGEVFGSGPSMLPHRRMSRELLPDPISSR